MLGQEGAAPRQDTQAGARPAFLFGTSAPALFGLALLFSDGIKCLTDDCDFLADHIEPAAVTDPVGAFAH